VGEGRHEESSVSPPDLLADAEAKLTAAGVDRLVEWDSFSDYDRLMRYGIHYVCGKPFASVRITTRNETGKVSVALDRMCPACDAWLDAGYPQTRQSSS
jgi:hypothetical protein